MPFFDRFGKLETGLRRLELHKTLQAGRNLGLHTLHPSNYVKESWEDKDPVWKASCILDSLRRAEDHAMQSPTPTLIANYGETPSISWLDRMEKQRSLDAINSELRQEPVRCTLHCLQCMLFTT
jgi:hypothetical protein